MNTLLLSTAAAAAFALPAFAENHTASFLETPAVDSLRASELLGQRIYASETATADMTTDGLQDGWNDIGEINDILLTRAGTLDAVLVDIGGFLGIGERQVAITMASLSFVADAATTDDPDDYFLVLAAPRELLETAPSYDAMAMTPVEGTDPATTEPMSEEEAAIDTILGTAPQTEAAQAPVRTMVDPGTITAEALTGTPVHGLGDEHIGEVGTVLMTTDGQIDGIVIDVGGFLGLGEKPVALNMADLTIEQDADTETLVVTVNQSEETLKDLPAYEY